MKNKLGYSLGVLSDVAKQRNKAEEETFLNALEIRLEWCPECLVMMDKAHKDWNMARRRRRRRGWKNKIQMMRPMNGIRIVPDTHCWQLQILMVLW